MSIFKVNDLFAHDNLLIFYGRVDFFRASESELAVSHITYTVLTGT